MLYKGANVTVNGKVTAKPYEKKDKTIGVSMEMYVNEIVVQSFKDKKEASDHINPVTDIEENDLPF